jgi:hypothetical protein
LRQIGHQPDKTSFDIIAILAGLSQIYYDPIPISGYLRQLALLVLESISSISSISSEARRNE